MLVNAALEVLPFILAVAVVDVATFAAASVWRCFHAGTLFVAATAAVADAGADVADELTAPADTSVVEGVDAVLPRRDDAADVAAVVTATLKLLRRSATLTLALRVLSTTSCVACCGAVVGSS